MIGQKGLPATYGGIEHHVEQLGRRLAERGHEVTVFSRRTYSDQGSTTYRGMRVKNAPTVATKRLDALVHSATSTASAMVGGYDVVHYHALGPGIFSVGPRYLSRAAVVQTVHGLDHQRDKWGKGSQGLLSAAHWVSGHVPDQTVVVSRALQEHYQDEFGRDSVYIANGVETPEPQPADVVRDRFGLTPGEYLLFVGRLVPEKGVDALIRAYRQVPGDATLVIAGGSSFTDEYTETLKSLAAQDPRVLMPGPVFGADLLALYQYARAFVQPSLLEGLPLTLLEALSHGLPIVASDIPPHQEVLGEPGAGRWVFPSGDEAGLTAALGQALASGPTERAAAGEFARDTLRDYDWDQAALELEAVYLEAARGHRRTSSSAATGTAQPADGPSRPPPQLERESA